MSKINVDTWEPESGTAATLMASGDTVTLPDGAILAVASGGDINVASGGEIDIASGATLDVNGTIDLTGATKTGFPDSALTVAQTFRETSNHTNGAASVVIGATNYEEADQDGYSSLGGITESAGVFTFPSTGRYLVMSVVAQSQAAALTTYTYIQYSDDSAVSWIQQSNAFVTFTTSATYSNSICHAVVNIADISTDRVQIEYAASSSVNTIYGSSDQNLTYTTLIKLA